MPRIPSPLHDKKIPRSVSRPTVTAEAAATIAESAVAPAVRKTRPAKPKTAAAPKAKAKAAPAAKKSTEPARKTAVPAKKAAAKTAPAKKAKADSTPSSTDKPAKPHKPKLVRDSFTIPKDEYAVLEALKSRALGLGQHVRKSELLRAGIQALGAMNDRALLAAVGAVPTLKTGRPKKA